jgi:hypothetical protein
LILGVVPGLAFEDLYLHIGVVWQLKRCLVEHPFLRIHQDVLAISKGFVFRVQVDPRGAEVKLSVGE